jgi:serine/threonine protein kinase
VCLSGFWQILRAWEEAGLVHGDLKPANIAVDTFGGDKVYFLDVESVVTLNKSVPFTPVSAGFRYTAKYAAPELLERDVVCSKSDLYSAGVSLLGLLEVCCLCLRLCRFLFRP